MKDEKRTRAQLLSEVRRMRRRVVELEAAETDRKRAERALADSEALYQSLVESLPQNIFRKDREGRFTFGNTNFCATLGRPLDEMLGKTDFDFYPAELAKKYREDDKKVMERGDVFEDVEEHQTPDGHRLYVQVVKTAVRDSKGEVVGIQGIFWDVTERKRAEQALKHYSEKLEEMVERRTKELQDAQEELIRKEKLAVLGQLAGGVGHELRNPLGAIKNAAYFLNMALEQPEPEVKETVEILEKEVATCERIISSLLDFARRKPPTRRKVDANEVVGEALSRAVVPQNVEVLTELQALPAILAAPDQIGQVFGNIILNAIQAMPEGGRLLVKSEVSSPGWVAISFTDTGVGIPEENLEKLFEPLFTAKAKGIGLGLAVSKTLVEGHGGTIEVQSPARRTSGTLEGGEVGKGSTFTVKLPVRGPARRTSGTLAGGKEEK